MNVQKVALLLLTIFNSSDSGTLSFTPTCPYDCYEAQMVYMKAYLNVLRHRAEIENVDVDETITFTRTIKDGDLLIPLRK